MAAEQDGWMKWVETAAALHSFVSKPAQLPCLLDLLHIEIIRLPL